MNAREMGHFPHWANRDDIGRFTPRTTSAPEPTVSLTALSNEVDDGCDPYSLDEYEAMRSDRDDDEERTAARRFAGYTRLDEAVPLS